MRISDWSSDVCSSDLLDEADRMLDMGFMPAIKRILQEVPNQRQTLLFSATFDAPIKQLAQQFMRNPVEIQVAARNSVAETVTHRVHPVDGARKRDPIGRASCRERVCPYV